MQTLTTLGLEINLRPTEAPPTWTVPLTAAASARAEASTGYGSPGQTRRERPAPRAPEAYRAGSE